MDAFTVSVCRGLARERVGLREAVWVGAWFGGFQALMPLLGCGIGALFQESVAALDHWVVFALLTVLGGGMAAGAFAPDDVPRRAASLAPAVMLASALATSIDALAAGFTFALLDCAPVPAALLIGAVTFLLSAVGVWVGSVFGAGCRRAAELAGGGILFLLGLRILLTHLAVF